MSGRSSLNSEKASLASVWSSVEAWNLADKPRLSPVSRDSNSSSNDGSEDASMRLASGSVVFLVQNRKFKLPKALLQQHSEAFAGMLTLDDGQDEAIILNDSVEAFSTFVSVLLTPFESCLTQGNGSHSDLVTILNLLEFSHKYCAAGIEKRSLARAIQLTKPKAAITIPKTLYPRIIEIAAIVDSPELGRVAQEHIIEDIWKHPEVTRIALEFGERLGHPLITASAYYAVMLWGPNIWRGDKALSDAQKDRLSWGTMQAAERWVDIRNDWLKKVLNCGQVDCPYSLSSVLNESLRIQTTKGSRVASYDVVGNVRSAMTAHQTHSSPPPYSLYHEECSASRWSLLVEAEKKAKDGVVGLFTLHAES